LLFGNRWPANKKDMEAAPPAPPAEVAAPVSAANKSELTSASAASTSAASASAKSASAPSSWPEFEAQFEVMMKDTKLRAELDKANPKLPEDQLPPNDFERNVIKQLWDSVNPEYIKEMNSDIAIRFVRGFTVGTYMKNDGLSEEEAVKKTIELLDYALEWRVTVGASSLCDRPTPNRELFKKLWVNGVAGVEKYGRQVWVVHPPSEKIMTELTGEELILNHARDMETLARKKTVEGAKMGHPAYKHVVIMDLGQESVSLKGMKFMRNTLGFKPKAAKEPLFITEWFYPDCMANMWIINAPFIFQAIWAVAKAFIHPVTRQKLQMCGSDYLEKMTAAGLTKSCLPKYMGGTGNDPIGYHYQVKVSAGYEEVVKMQARRGETISWDIELQKHDVNVSGEIVGDSQALVKKTLLKAGGCIQGRRVMERDGEVRFVFCNKHSSWYSKAVRYDIRIVRNETDSEISTPSAGGAAAAAAGGGNAAAAASTE